MIDSPTENHLNKEGIKEIGVLFPGSGGGGEEKHNKQTKTVVLTTTQNMFWKKTLQLEGGLGCQVSCQAVEPWIGGIFDSAIHIAASAGCSMVLSIIFPKPVHPNPLVCSSPPVPSHKLAVNVDECSELLYSPCLLP